jgi:predicted CoA-binding protein
MESIPPVLSDFARLDSVYCSLEVMSAVRWLKLSYWVGAVADGAAAVLMLMPVAGMALYGVTDYEPTVAYTYAMRFGAALMVGWTVLLLWANRKPLERRGVLPITVLVIAGLAWAGGYAVSEGLITAARMVPTWILQALLAALFLYSYIRSLGATEKAELPEGQVPLEDAATDFLAQQRIAVAGVSRDGNAAANYIFKRLLETDRHVFAINPNADEVEGERCYPSLAALPESVDAVVIATHPDHSIDVARQCEAAGVQHVWFHRSIDRGSFTQEAADLCARYGATVIPGGCPMMHLQPVDMPHRCMYLVLNKLGALPTGVELVEPGRSD